ncbi:MAG: PKD domain-containing protein [Sphingobacteriales bacterium]|nr:MAG: PKD domain-containing protein [Sphingobacteriales bacterium]
MGFQCRSYYLPTTGITQWTWDFGDGTPPFIGTQTEGHTYANPGVYTATLTITNGDCVTTGSKTITVAPLPNAGFTISGGECVGSSLQFLPDVPNLSSYFWQLGNGASTAQHNPAFAYTQAGEYQVSLQVQDNKGCSSDIQTQTLIVLDAPPTQSVTAADTIFCAGLSTTLTAPPDGVAYLWSNGQTTPEINVSTSGNYTVQVTLPDGCAYTSPLVQVQVTPNPTADISPTSPINFCIGDSVTLQVPFNENYIYQWSENNNGQAQNTYNLSGNIGVTRTDTLTGCTAIGTAQLIDNASPPKPIITASALQICEGQSVNFSIASSTDPLHTYHWTTGATGTGISVFTSGNYGVWAQNQFGCSSDTSLLLNVVVNPLPDAGIFPAGCYALCPGDVVSIPPNTAQNYQWYYNGNPLSGITGSSWIPEAEGAYWVVMSNGNCTVTSDVLQLVFIADCPPLPVSLITFTGTVLPHANQLQWTTAAEVNNAFFTLQHSPDGSRFTTLAQLTGAGNSSMAKNYEHLDSNPYPLTYYRLMQTDFDGSTRQAGNVITLLRSQTTGSFALTHIIPTPTQHTATLTYTTKNTQPVTLSLYDVTGRLLQHETLQATIGTNNHVLDMTKYPNGLYVVTLNNGVEVVSGKVVKE